MIPVPRLIRPALPIMLLASAACSDAIVDPAEPAPSETSLPVASDGGTGGGTAPPSEAAERPTTAISPTMPAAIRGQWREDDLGRAPTLEDCDQTSSSNRNFGKVLTVRADGYSLFEDGGRIIEVHNRTDTMIDATFDTTYADTPTSARRDFALQPGGSLAVNDDNGDGSLAVTQYRRCPEE